MPNYYYVIGSRVYQAGKGFVCAWPTPALAVKDANSSNLKLWMEESKFTVSQEDCPHATLERNGDHRQCLDCGKIVEPQ